MTTEIKPAQLTDLKLVNLFLFAGNATVTFRSVKTGTRYTYKISAMKDRVTGEVTPGKYFVSLLTGADNENDFTYLGMIADKRFFTTRASKMNMNSAPVKAFNWAVQQLVEGYMPQDMEVWHEARCGRCGRKLTVPESVATGFGPDCAEIVGVETVTLPVTGETPNPEVPVTVTVEQPKSDFAKDFAAVQAVDARSDNTDPEVAARVAELKADNPEQFYSDGEMDEAEATAFWTRRFTTDKKTPVGGTVRGELDPGAKLLILLEKSE